jgi:hypothetical protein
MRERGERGVLTENDGSAESSSDITHVLMASPETKDEAAVFNGLLVAEPVTHNGSSCRFVCETTRN